MQKVRWDLNAHVPDWGLQLRTATGACYPKAGQLGPVERLLPIERPYAESVGRS